MNEDWRNLKVGDMIRIVQLPTEISDAPPGYRLPAETQQLYRRLQILGTPLRVFEIDSNGVPWIKCSFGGSDIHFLAINDNSWTRIDNRNQ